MSFSEEIDKPESVTVLLKRKKKKKKLSRLYIKLKLNRPFRHCTSLVVNASMTGKMLKLYQEVFHR